MPRVSAFYGIVIAVYYDDVGPHSAPHFHATYAEPCSASRTAT